MDKNTRFNYRWIIRNSLSSKDTHRLKVKGWNKISYANENQKKAGITILIPNKIDFNSKVVKRDKKGHYKITWGSVQQVEITILNIYISNIRAAKYMKQVLTDLKVKVDSNTITVSYFNTPLFTMDISCRYKTKIRVKLQPRPIAPNRQLQNIPFHKK